MTITINHPESGRNQGHTRLVVGAFAVVLAISVAVGVQVTLGCFVRHRHLRGIHDYRHIVVMLLGQHFTFENRPCAALERRDDIRVGFFRVARILFEEFEIQAVIRRDGNLRRFGPLRVRKSVAFEQVKIEGRVFLGRNVVRQVIVECSDCLV